MRRPYIRRVSGGDVAAVQTLLKEGANVNAKDDLGGTPLHELANGIWVTSNRSEELRIARILLENGADKRSENAHGDTPGGVARRLHRNELSCCAGEIKGGRNGGRNGDAASIGTWATKTSCVPVSTSSVLAASPQRWAFWELRLR